MSRHCGMKCPRFSFQRNKLYRQLTSIEVDVETPLRDLSALKECHAFLVECNIKVWFEFDFNVACKKARIYVYSDHMITFWLGVHWLILPRKKKISLSFWNNRNIHQNWKESCCYNTNWVFSNVRIFAILHSGQFRILWSNCHMLCAYSCVQFW
jgi:hypothetical protein